MGYGRCGGSCPLVPTPRLCCRLFPGGNQVWPWIQRGEGGDSIPGVLGWARGDRKQGHRGLSLATAAQPQSGRKLCRALSAAASLAILFNRKQGSAGAGRRRRQRRTPGPPRAPVGPSEDEADQRTPRGAGAAEQRGRVGGGEGGAEPRGKGLTGGSSRPWSSAGRLPFTR